jgi:SAM-dependent methyltransferase
MHTMSRLQPASSQQRLKTFYQSSTSYLNGLRAKTSDHYAGYVDTVHRCARPGSRVLDLGAGAGLSTSLLAEWFSAVAVDVSWLFLNEGSRGRACPTRVAADAECLPFASASVDVVGAFEMIEHVSDVSATLAEADRVLKPGGLIVVVSPNLLSPINPILCFFSEPWHDAPKLAREFVRGLCSTTARLLTRRPSFYRLTIPPSADLHSDQDAAHAVSPLDLRNWLRQRGYRIVRYQRDGRTRRGRMINRLFRSYASTIYVVAEKAGG